MGRKNSEAQEEEFCSDEQRIRDDCVCSGTNVAVAVCITILIILFAGEPDLMDAIIDYIRANTAAK